MLPAAFPTGTRYDSVVDTDVPGSVPSAGSRAGCTAESRPHPAPRGVHGSHPPCVTGWEAESRGSRPPPRPGRDGAPAPASPPALAVFGFLSSQTRHPNVRPRRHLAFSLCPKVPSS